MGWTSALILFCFFFSGASSLIYEVIWLRMLILIFGSTTLAVSTVLAAFMGGLGLGSIWFGRFIDRRRRPLLTYGLLEIGIGLYGLLVPLLFPLLVPLSQLITQSIDPSFTFFSLLRFVVVFIVLLIPTTLMGATLPVLSSAWTTRHEGSGRRVGLLYGLNTAGAVLGTAGTGFLLLPALGIRQSTLVAVGINIIIGLLITVLMRKRERLQDSPRQAAQVPAPPAGSTALPKVSGLTLVLVLLPLAISGYTAMVYEVAWMRVLSLILGSSVFAFSAMLTTFLLGLALGSLFFSRLLNRFKIPVRALAWLQIGIGLTTYYTSAHLEQLPYFFLKAMSWGQPLFLDYMDWWITSLWFLTALAIMLVPTFLFGGTFPLVARIYQQYTRPMGRIAGDVYFSNTLGAIAGSFMGGFVLIPLLGIRWTLLSTILINIGLGAALLMQSPLPGRLRQVVTVAGVLVLGLVLGLVRIPWNPAMMSFNLGIEYPTYLKIVEDLEGGWPEFDRKITQNLEIEFYEEGTSATVQVVRDAVGHQYLKNDGRPEGGEPYLRTHTLLGHLPLFLREQNRDTLMIGLGTGVTLGAVQQHLLEQIEVIELEPAVVRAAAYFRDISRHQMDDPRLKMTINDGRNRLLLTENQYDTIISQPSLPWLTGMANLFTEDFFRLGASRLRPAGIFCQWISVYGMTLDGFLSVLAAFQAVFPYVMVFDPAPADMILIGSSEPVRFDLAAMEIKLNQSAVRRDLERVQINTVQDLLATFKIGSGGLEPLLAGAVINTDDNARLEVIGPRDYYSGKVTGQPEYIRTRFYQNHDNIEQYIDWAEPPAPETLSEYLLGLSTAYARQDILGLASYYADRSLTVHESAGGHLQMAQLLAAYTVQRTDLALAERRSFMEAAIQATEVALSLDARSIGALALQAILYQQLGQRDQAIDVYQRLTRLDDTLPDPHYSAAVLLQGQGRHQEARHHYEKFLSLVTGLEDYAGLVELARKQLDVLQD